METGVVSIVPVTSVFVSVNWAVKSGVTFEEVAVNWFKSTFSVNELVVCSWFSDVWNWFIFSMEADGWVVIFPTWDNLNCCSCFIDLIISWVFAFSVCFIIWEGSNPISLLKLISKFVVFVVVVVIPCCIDWVPVKDAELTEVVFTFVLTMAPVLKEEVELTFVLVICPPVKGISTRCFVRFSIIKNTNFTKVPSSTIFTFWTFKVLSIHWTASVALWIDSNTDPIFFQVSIVKTLINPVLLPSLLTDILISFPKTEVVKIYVLFFWVNLYECLFVSIFKMKYLFCDNF